MKVETEIGKIKIDGTIGYRRLRFYERYNPFFWIYHYIQHLLGSNVGSVGFWKERDADTEYECMGFVCRCGKLDKKTIVRTRFDWVENYKLTEEE